MANHQGIPWLRTDVFPIHTHGPQQRRTMHLQFQYYKNKRPIYKCQRCGKFFAGALGADQDEGWVYWTGHGPPARQKMSGGPVF